MSQAIARVVFRNRAKFERGIMQIVSERGRVFRELSQMPGITAYPSNANYILFRAEGAGEVWQQLYDRGILVRDFSRAPMLQDCLRVSIGSPEENDEFLAALREILRGKDRAPRGRYAARPDTLGRSVICPESPRTRRKKGEQQ